MYSYRRLTPLQQRDLLRHRRRHQLPLHEPPHFVSGTATTYLLTAATFEHQPILHTAARRHCFESALLAAVEALRAAAVHAWVILPNHYHLLATVELSEFARRIARLHNGTATEWNREDDRAGRKVWFRFADRVIRNEAHYWATVNYIHANPVRHRHAQRADHWRWSSLGEYLTVHGREALRQLWERYPVDDYGRGWDW
jgi:putative transposase